MAIPCLARLFRLRRAGFMRNEGGSIAILSAFFLPVLALLIGIGFDFDRVSRSRRAYQHALDDAVAAARHRRDRMEDPSAAARFLARVGSKHAHDLTDFTLTRDKGGWRAAATGRTPTPFLALLRMPHVEFQVEAVTRH